MSSRTPEARQRRKDVPTFFLFQFRRVKSVIQYGFRTRNAHQSTWTTFTLETHLWLVPSLSRLTLIFTAKRMEITDACRAFTVAKHHYFTSHSDYRWLQKVPEAIPIPKSAVHPDHTHTHTHTITHLTAEAQECKVRQSPARVGKAEETEPETNLRIGQKSEIRLEPRSCWSNLTRVTSSGNCPSPPPPPRPPPPPPPPRPVPSPPVLPLAPPKLGLPVTDWDRTNDKLRR